MSLLGNLKEIQAKAVDEKVIEFAEEKKGLFNLSYYEHYICFNLNE